MKISAISPAYFFLIIMTQTGHGRPSRGSRCQGPASTLASTPVPRCRFGAEHDECGGVLRCLRGPGERCGARWEQTYYTSEMRIWSSSCLAFTKKVNAFSKSFFLLFENKVEDFIGAWYLHVNASMHRHRHWSSVPDTFPLYVTEICHAGQVLKSLCTVYIFTSEWNKSFDSKF